MSYIVYFNLMSYTVRNSYITKNSDFHYFGTTIKVSAVLWLSQDSMGEESPPGSCSSSLVLGWRLHSVLSTREFPASLVKHTRAGERECQQERSHSLL